MEIMKLKKNALFNPAGDTETRPQKDDWETRQTLTTSTMCGING